MMEVEMSFKRQGRMELTRILRVAIDGETSFTDAVQVPVKLEGRQYGGDVEVDDALVSENVFFGGKVILPEGHRMDMRKFLDEEVDRAADAIRQ